MDSVLAKKSNIKRKIILSRTFTLGVLEFIENRCSNVACIKPFTIPRRFKGVRPKVKLMPLRMKGINCGRCLNVDLSGDLTRKFVAFRPSVSWLGDFFLAMLKVFFSFG